MSPGNPAIKQIWTAYFQMKIIPSPSPSHAIVDAQQSTLHKGHHLTDEFWLAHVVPGVIKHGNLEITNL